MKPTNDDDEESLGTLETADLTLQTRSGSSDCLNEVKTGIGTKDAVKYGATAESLPRNNNTESGSSASQKRVQFQSNAFRKTPADRGKARRSSEREFWKKRSLPPQITHDYFMQMEKKEIIERSLNWCISSAIVTVLLVALVTIPISSIVVGGVSMGHCKVDPTLPLWMIGYGLVFLLFLLALIVIQIYARQRQEKLFECNCIKGQETLEADLYANEQLVSRGILIVFTLFAVFLFCWFVFGNVSLYKHWTEMKESSENCNHLLFYFTLAILLNCYVVFVFLFCFLGLSALQICCLV